MKRTFKIALLVSAAVVAVSVSVRLGGPVRTADELAASVPQSSHTNVPPPATPLALAAPAPSSAAPKAIPETIRPIVSATSATVADRVTGVRALPADLTREEIQPLYEFLLAPAQAITSNPQNENWLRNEIMDKLTDQSALPAGLAKVLVAIYEDPTKDNVIRDYAVQHMTPVYAESSPEEKATLEQTLWSAVAETDSSIAGTALLALHDLAKVHPEVEPNRLREAALRLVEDVRCGELSRITALQICGRMSINQAGPLALQLAQTARSVPLQIAAIAALGSVGDEQARNYLRQLAAQPEPRLRPAVESALKQMNQRWGI